MSEGSPRPTFPGPAPIPYSAATRFTWGDAATGRVEDWIYVSSDKIHQLVFELPPGGGFRHSEQNRTIFGADEVYCVLEGVLALANPETGEVHRVVAGESAFFRKDTWHHGFNRGSGPLRVLEYFSPPPSKGTSQAYAKTKPYLSTSKYVKADPGGKDTIRVLRDPDVRWRLEGDAQQAMIGIIASTENLTVARLQLLPGQDSGPRSHAGDLSLYVMSGSLTVRVDGGSHLLAPKDGFYVPQGVSYAFANGGREPVEVIFGVAPIY